MFLKTDWLTHLHRTREEEIESVFIFFNDKKFKSGLEIGAGDGFQTSLLAKKIDKLVSTDLNFNRIKIKVDGVEYIKIDADNLDNDFTPEQFDIIFSSSVLEHLSDLDNFLIKSKSFLKKDGYAVHFVPTRFMKFFYIVMFYPNLFLLILDRLVGVIRGKKIFRGENINLENNINASKKNVNKLMSIFLPSVHGSYSSHFDEFIQWGSKNWENHFINDGYEIVSVIKGGAHSGYGFGVDFVRPILRFLNISSLNGYVTRKK